MSNAKLHNVTSQADFTPTPFIIQPATMTPDFSPWSVGFSLTMGLMTALLHTYLNQ